MFCYQCEQVSKGKGCTVQGVCGKDEATSALQDLLLYAVKGVSMYAHRAHALGARDEAVDEFTVEAVFSTLTNVDFDPARLAGLIEKAVAMRGRAKELYEATCVRAGKTPEALDGPAAWTPGSYEVAKLADQAGGTSITARQAAFGEDIAGLMELLTYGIKGIAAYADHAQILGVKDAALYGSVHEMLDYLTHDSFTVDGLFGMCMKAGETNLKAMELLDSANTGAYGHPEPTPVQVTARKGKAILVSGHDLKDLEAVLKQTEGKGINVYTHGEMLPAHGYPELRKYPHLAGNYGGAWQDQAKEFDAFPGSILMTTNCIQKPKGYKDRIFTSGLVAWPGVRHISDGDFTPLIDAALAEPGFAEDEPVKTVLTGFARNAVLGVADKVIDAVKSGAVKRFFLIGGCDGAKSGRNYYTDFAKAVPEDCIILTLACGKYRFNKLEFGEIGGIPRLLDIGQCNDAYSAIKIAVALAEAFGCGVNDLPLSLVLSWYEQKAVAILLTLLFLGIKGIRIGPSLPAFITPAVLEVLAGKFGLAPITTPEADMEAIMGVCV